MSSGKIGTSTSMLRDENKMLDVGGQLMAVTLSATSTSQVLAEFAS